MRRPPRLTLRRGIVRARRAGPAAVLACLVVSLSALPLGAQPFADAGVPPWAYAAMKSLAAHGVLASPPAALRQGRLDRMGMAALLAEVVADVTGRHATARRVTRQDLLAIEALLREFEEELASLGVRVEVAREALQTLALQGHGARISGDVRIRYEVGRSALENPGTGPVLPASTQPWLPAASTRWRLLIDGGLTDDLRMKLRLSTFNVAGSTVGVWGGVPPTGHLNSPFLPWNSSNVGLTLVDTFSLDWTHAFGLPLRVQLGLLGGDTWVPREGDPLTPLSLTSTPPVALQLGPLGLLFSTVKDPTGERTLRTNSLEAIAFDYGAGRTRAQGVVANVEGLQGFGNETFYGGRIQSTVLPDVTLGLNGVVDTCDGTGAVNNSALVSALTALGAGRGVAQCSFVWWGAQNGWTPSLNTGSTNPITNVPGSGYSADIDARLSPSLRAQAEWGIWNDPTAQTTGNGWQAQLVIGPPQGPGPSVIVGYQSFQPAFYPSLGGAEDPVVGFIYPGGFQDGFIIVILPALRGWVFSAGYEAGISLGVGPQPGAVGFGGPTFSSAVCERCSPAGEPFTGWLGSVTREIGPRTTLHLYYYGWNVNGASQADAFRVELGYRF